MSLKLTMIGCSGTGKTCYLYGTYARMLKGISGFNFNIKDHNQGLDLEDAWFSLIDNNASWPPGSNESTNFEFSCLYNGSSIGDFQWLDYRGGILNDRTEEDPQGKVNLFHQKVRGSDSLLVCLPAEMLLGILVDKQNRQTERMLARYRAILSQTPGITDISVTFMITKSDRLFIRDDNEEIDKEKSKEQMKSCVKMVYDNFPQFFSEAQKDVMISLVRLGKFKGELKQGSPIDGEISPHNIHLPILFPVFLETSKSEAILKQWGEEARRNGRIDASRGFWSKFWNGDNSAEYFADAESYFAKARRFKTIANTIWNEFDGSVDIFHKGKCVLNSSKNNY